MKGSIRSASGPLFCAVIFAIVATAGCFNWRNKSTPAATPQALPAQSAEQIPSGATGPTDELQAHCDQLARATPGIEELRVNSDGTIESRQWTLTENDSEPRWAVVRAQNQPGGGWTAKPGIAKLNFDPPLQTALAKGSDQFLAYAPIDVANYTHMMDTLNEVFGGAQGKFVWRGRTYAYALKTELPCYPPLR